jgi:hypothetical protein
MTYTTTRQTTHSVITAQRQYTYHIQGHAIMASSDASSKDYLPANGLTNPIGANGGAVI